MSNFKVGQKVVCVSPKSGWNIKKNFLFFKWKSYVTGPDINDIVTIRQIRQDGYLFLSEYRVINSRGEAAYNPINFRPLDHQFAEDVIAAICESVKEDELTLV